MVDWNRFVPSDFEYDFENDNSLLITSQSMKRLNASTQIMKSDETRSTAIDRYQLVGRTLGGRSLRIIFQLKPGNVVRIITGWPL